MKKLSVFILSLYLMLFCLTGCWDNDLCSYIGFEYGPDIIEINCAGVAGVYNQTEALNRDDFKIKISYGWQERHEASYLFTDEYRIDLKDIFGGIKLDFRHSENILIPSQILDVDYEMGADYKGRKEKWTTFALALLLIHTDSDTNNTLTNRLGCIKITTVEYEDGQLLIRGFNTSW